MKLDIHILIAATNKTFFIFILPYSERIGQKCCGLVSCLFHTGCASKRQSAVGDHT